LLRGSAEREERGDARRIAARLVEHLHALLRLGFAKLLLTDEAGEVML